MDKAEKAIAQAIKTLERVKSLIESGVIQDGNSLDIIQVAINGIYIIEKRYAGQRLKKNTNKFIDNYSAERNTQKNEKLN